MEPFSLSEGQFEIVYNSFSFAIAAMGASLLFFLLKRTELPVPYRGAVTLSALVVGIALYHYLRIFESWESAFTLVDGRYVMDGTFNEGYRYVDWLLTVPLLLAELVLVLRLSKGRTRSLITRLTIAAVLMIATGYPGEIADPDSFTRTFWGVVSTVPFVYILYVLFAELQSVIRTQPEESRPWFDGLRWLLLATWGVYPLAYLAPQVIDDAAAAEVIRQVGYSVADVLAKPVFGLMILAIAFMKARRAGALEAQPDDVAALTDDDPRVGSIAG